MKGFEEGFSSSKPNPNRSPSPSGSMENDENDSSVDKLISQFEHHDITHGKHFMPGAPRKKILAEIYQFPSASDAQNHGSPILSPSKKVLSHSVVWRHGHASEPKEDSSVKGYDPLTNYLSPRPKYLRFNPYRRSEILKRLENEGREELDSPDFVKGCDEEESSPQEIEDSSLSPPKDCAVNQRTGEVSDEANDDAVDGYGEEEEVGEEEEIEERGWCVSGVLKLLLTLIACLWSTSYICSMNSSTISPSQQAVWNLQDGGVVIKNGSLDFISRKMRVDGFFQVEVGGDHGLIKEVEVDDHESFEQFENFKIDESLETEEAEEEEEDDEESYGEIDENFEAEVVEDLERFEREVIRNENDSEERVDESADFKLRADEGEPLFHAKTDEEADSGLDVYEASETEIIISGGGEVDSYPQRWGQLMDAQTVEREDETGSVELVEELSDSIMDEVDDDEEEEEVGEEKPEWNTTTVVGISGVITVLGSLAIICNSKKSRSSSSSKEFEPKQSIAVEESELPPSIERKVEFLSRAPMREAPRELACNVHAPTVELIGEVIIGKPRGLGKYKMSISEDDGNVATLHQSHASLPQPVSGPSQPPSTELHPTTSNYSSYESFTAERKISRKQGGQSTEPTVETTPVRRSSRLRNRSTVKSP